MDIVSNTKSSATQTKKSKSKLAVRSYINGAPAQSSSSEILQLFNPADGCESIVIPAGSELDALQAVASSKEAFVKGLWPSPKSYPTKSIAYLR